MCKIIRAWEAIRVSQSERHIISVTFDLFQEESIIMLVLCLDGKYNYYFDFLFRETLCSKVIARCLSSPSIYNLLAHKSHMLAIITKIKEYIYIYIYIYIYCDLRRVTALKR
jgi:hypothetical protein